MQIRTAQDDRFRRVKQVFEHLHRIKAMFGTGAQDAGAGQDGMGVSPSVGAIAAAGFVPRHCGPQVARGGIVRGGHRLVQKGRTSVGKRFESHEDGRIILLSRQV